MSQTDRLAAIDYLAGDALLHAAHLKLLAMSPGQARVQAIRDARGAVCGAIISLPVAASPFDADAYPLCRMIGMPVCGDPELLLDALAGWDGASTVWKVFPELAECLAHRYGLRRVTSYISLSGTVVHAGDPAVLVSAEPPPSWQRLMPHITPQALSRGLHFAGVDAAGIACVARAWPIHGDLWEVGGLFTDPARRGQGWAIRVVRTAVGYVCSRGLRPRYVVREDHGASLAVAHRVGLGEICRLEHWVPARDACQGDGPGGGLPHVAMA